IQRLLLSVGLRRRRAIHVVSQQVHRSRPIDVARRCFPGDRVSSFGLFIPSPDYRWRLGHLGGGLHQKEVRIRSALASRVHIANRVTQSRWFAGQLERSEEHTSELQSLAYL